jgi:hypothetical protein
MLRPKVIVNVEDFVVQDADCLAVLSPWIIEGVGTVHALGVAPVPTSQRCAAPVAPCLPIRQQIVVQEDSAEAVIERLAELAEAELAPALVRAKPVAGPHIAARINQDYASACPTRETGGSGERMNRPDSFAEVVDIGLFARDQGVNVELPQLFVLVA